MESIKICTWVYCDQVGEESEYPQTGITSTDIKHQLIYWKCAVTFFATSKKCNPHVRHILYTNVTQIPDINDFKTADFLKNLEVEIKVIPLTYRTPEGYYGQWKNQFYLFDIIKEISNSCDDADQYIVLDSDCVWSRSVNEISKSIKEKGLLGLMDETKDTNYRMNGLSRSDMKEIYEDNLNQPISDIPFYFGGEWFGATGSEIKKVANEIDGTWMFSLERFYQNKTKFNEEAHILSFIYYKLGYRSKTANQYIRRIWTNFKFTNTRKEDLQLAIWHLPSEKKTGFNRLFSKVRDKRSKFWKINSGEEYVLYLASFFGIPKRSAFKAALDVVNLFKYRYHIKISKS